LSKILDLPCYFDDSFDLPFLVRDDAGKEGEMTVCISGICDSGRAIVVACDREIRASSTMITLEAAESKATILFDRIVVATAGPLQRRSDVFSKALCALKRQNASYSDVLASLRGAFKSVRNEYADTRIFSPRGLSLDTFYRRLERKQHWTEFERDIDRRNMGCKLRESLLVCGLEDGKAKISVISGSGDWASFGMVGHTAQGSGDHLATAWLLARGYSANFPMNQAVYAVYEAKKVSEAAAGVGVATDIYLIDHSGAREISAKCLSEFERIWKRHKRKLVSLLTTREGLAVAVALNNSPPPDQIA
jgi:20S proteasome alpha/beta subunit